MVYAQRKQQIEGYQVKGGILGLAAATLAGVLIISVQLLQMFNLLPTVG